MHASFETCAKRDPKGLYAKVAAGQVKQFTGRDSGFEVPAASAVDVMVDTEQLDIAAGVEQVWRALAPK